jgi:hypothetical protein
VNDNSPGCRFFRYKTTAKRNQHASIEIARIWSFAHHIETAVALSLEIVMSDLAVAVACVIRGINRTQRFVKRIDAGKRFGVL